MKQFLLPRPDPMEYFGLDSSGSAYVKNLVYKRASCG
jgi:hypothetical protein